jgi:glycosyltransferase involved in cell wall biosynthesis
MKLEILLSCMNQSDERLIGESRITADALVVNQCGREGVREFPTDHGRVRWIDSATRGLTVSRNLAVEESDAGVCLLCDDDEVFEEDYEKKILDAYKLLPQADVVIFNMVNRPAVLGTEVKPLRFPKTMRVSSWQISFRRQRLVDSGVRFDELLGAGTGNGAEEELKFLTDCEKAGLKIYYVPEAIASVAQAESTWFHGFDETFFYNRGATTRYILGYPVAAMYALYYVVRKKEMYAEYLSPMKALKAIFRGMHDNKITKQAEERKRNLRRK